MPAKQRDFRLSPKSTRLLIIHTKYAERGGECSVVQNEVILLKKNGFQVKELYFDNRKSKLLNILSMAFNIISFFRVLIVCLRYKPALVHIHNTHFAGSPSIIRAIKILKIPVVKTLHSYRLLCPSGSLFFRGKLYLKSLNVSFPWQAIKEKVYRNSLLLTFWLSLSNWFNRKTGTWKKIDKYFVFSEQGRQLFLNSNLGITDSQVIIKPNFSKKNAEPSVKRGDNFLYIGRLSQEKGIGILLDAFIQNGLPLTIIGDGPYNSEVKKAIRQNPLIEWKGYQTSEVINQELKKCAALIFPSICYEGMPVSIIEAFAASTPVIASRLGVMEKMVRHNHNGLLFEAGNADDLNMQLLKWDNCTKEEKNNLSKNAMKEYEDKYTPEKNIRILLSVYDTLIFEKQIPLKKFTMYKNDTQKKQPSVAPLDNNIVAG
ncbi:MAG: glycosyltransferase [Ferruginibacter sp.]